MNVDFIPGEADWTIITLPEPSSAALTAVAGESCTCSGGDDHALSEQISYLPSAQVGWPIKRRTIASVWIVVKNCRWAYFCPRKNQGRRFWPPAPPLWNAVKNLSLDGLVLGFQCLGAVFRAASITCSSATGFPPCRLLSSAASMKAKSSIVVSALPGACRNERIWPLPSPADHSRRNLHCARWSSIRTPLPRSCGGPVLSAFHGMFRCGHPSKHPQRNRCRRCAFARPFRSLSP